MNDRISTVYEQYSEVHTFLNKMLYLADHNQIPNELYDEIDEIENKMNRAQSSLVRLSSYMIDDKL